MEKNRTLDILVLPVESQGPEEFYSIVQETLLIPK